MKKSSVLFLTAAFAVGLLAAFFFFNETKVEPPPKTPETTVKEKPTAEGQPEPVVRLPVTPPTAEPVETPAVEELPPLEKSDPIMKETLDSILPQEKLQEMFIFDQLIRRFVLMVDSLPRADLSYKRLPLYTPFDRFVPDEKGGTLFISPENYKRYAPFINLVEKVEMKEAAQIYHHYYSLFQKAYRELGYPEGRFSERFIEVVDHLLAVPDVQYPVHLVQPHIRYQYANPQLERLSAGQKLLIRMGPDNSRIVLDKLRELRPLLINPEPAEN